MDLLETLELPLGFVSVLQESGLAFFPLCSPSHLRQGLQDLLLSVVDVLEGVEKQVIEYLSCHCGRAHLVMM